MSNLLVIEASPRGETSVSRSMTSHFVEEWEFVNPEGKVTRRDLTGSLLAFVDAPWMAVDFVPGQPRPSQASAALKESCELVQELLDADVIVIGTPVYYSSVPPVLKAWVEHLIRQGMTLDFTGEESLKGKRCTVLLASGGTVTQASPIPDRDMAKLWLRLMLNVLGIDNVEFISAAGTKVIDLGEQSQEQYMAPILPLIRDAAVLCI
jgi:FMN-dependent NADH-azoreductase